MPASTRIRHEALDNAAAVMRASIRDDYAGASAALDSFTDLEVRSVASYLTVLAAATLEAVCYLTERDPESFLVNLIAWEHSVVAGLEAGQ